MFTGIVEVALPIAGLKKANAGMRLTLRLPESWKDDVVLGASIAINGCCLTVSALEGASASFDIVSETLDKTSLGSLETGSYVNVERAMQLGSRIDGHLVQGHVDERGIIEQIAKAGGDIRLTIRPSPGFCETLIPKGSVCVDGISLTIAELNNESFALAIIPHTWELTNLRFRKIGDPVNLEGDMVGKYVLRRLDAMAKTSSPITENSLRKYGFL